MHDRFVRHDGFGHNGLGVLLLLLGVIALAALTAYLVVAISRRSHASAPAPIGPPPGYGRPLGDPALDAVRARYARGEIDRDAYLAIVSDLTGGSAAPPPSG